MATNYSETRREIDKQLRLRARNHVAMYKQTHSCIDCGEADPIVLEFDHRDPAEKKYGIAQLVSRGMSLDTIQAEIEKCDVRCANCHKKRHARERGTV